MSEVILHLDDFKVAIDRGKVEWVCSICGHSTKYPSHIMAHVAMKHTGLAEYVEYFNEIEYRKRKGAKITVGEMRP